MRRRFAPPWSAERIPGGYVVKDAVCYASGLWTRCMRPSKSLPLTAIRTSRLLPSMPHDSAKAYQLASSHFDGTDHRATVGAATLCGVRRPASLG